MTDLLKLLETLQTPALILSGFVIWMLFTALKESHKAFGSLAEEISEGGKTTAKMAALLDLVCNHLIGGGGREK
jgi:hypothetical protein